MEVLERSWGGFERFGKVLERFSDWRGLLKGFGEGFGSFEKTRRGFGVVSRRFLAAWRGL